MSQTNRMNGKLSKILIWIFIQWVKWSLHCQIFMSEEGNSVRWDIRWKDVILIIRENSGTTLFSLLEWENFLSKNMLTRFRCTCSAPHFWHVHSTSLDFKFTYKFKNTENVLQTCPSMLYTTQTLRVLHIQGVPGGMCRTSGGCSLC